ncbi:porin family protein [Rufibacter sp. LB8]|uniref:porin family protein n=1 Tax=Rufibacter sp. LB8 TaxID=2777781 RepID=UPI00178C67CF|nr:porin family protein [Rufibacter sp. LB8]
MKKLTILLICLLGFGAAQAQERVLNRGIINHRDGDGVVAPTRANNGFGVKGGLLYTSLRGDGSDQIAGLKSASNWHAGFYAQFSLNNVFSIQPEALYSRREVKSDNGGLQMDYIDIPVLAVFNFTENVSLHAGPQVGVMMTLRQDGKELDKEGYNTFDYGVAAGLEARLSIFRLGGRYYMSLADIGDGSTQNLSSAAFNDIKAGNFQVYIGIGF